MACWSRYNLPGRFTLACGLGGSFCGGTYSVLTSKHKRLASRTEQKPQAITSHSNQDKARTRSQHPNSTTLQGQLFTARGRSCTKSYAPAQFYSLKSPPIRPPPRMAGLTPIFPIDRQSYKIHSYHCPEWEGATGTAPGLP